MADAASDADSEPTAPLLQRRRREISFVLGLALLVLAAVIALKGHYTPCGVLLAFGTYYVNRGLGWPVTLDLLSARVR